VSFDVAADAYDRYMGRYSSQLSAADMQAFTSFILTVQYPPNPIHNLDATNSLTAQQTTGQTEMTSAGRDAGQPCTFCHVLPLGTDGFSSFEGESQELPPVEASKGAQPPEVRKGAPPAEDAAPGRRGGPARDASRAGVGSRGGLSGR